MTRYDAYILRVWRGERGDDARWAGRLEHLPDGWHRRFGSLDELLEQLRYLLDEERGATPGDGPVREREQLAPE